MTTLLWTAAGVALLLLVAYDVYATVLHASAHYGPVGERLNRLAWRVARFFASRGGRRRRHAWLNVVGPLLLPLLVATYIILLVVGFALIYYPHIAEGFTHDHPHTGDLFDEALYFSGVTLTTVGYGDVAPVHSWMRALAVVEAASGFALISLSITYLLSVYSALERKRAFALSLYHQAGEGADASGLIAHHFVDGRFYGLREALRQATRDIQAMLESHIEHPVIHYFHPLETYKSLPRILFLLLEACAVLRAAFDSDECSDLRNYPEVRTLEASSLHVLGELVESLDLERRERRKLSREEVEEDESRWRRRYEQHLRRLSAAGIKTRGQAVEGWTEYRDRRRLWESKLNRFSIYLGYEWEEVAGDDDLDYAHDEEREEPRRRK
ncbi:MAG TPA: potassium channel family protein [Pyrinomonadaceae bacterium]|nr:potassium channel family protein [Pyrinomonadaceae bacterium]